jgi:hypothetical protein
MKTQKIVTSVLMVFMLSTILAMPSEAQRPEPLQSANVSSIVGTAFSYQGQLKKNGNFVNGTCDFEFSLWDQAGSGTPPTGGIQIGDMQSKSGIAVTTEGLFTVILDFGNNVFRGETRYLQIAVQCVGDNNMNTLTPRQLLYATPYALSLRPGAMIWGDDSLVDRAALWGIGHAFGVHGGSRGSGGVGVLGVADGTSGNNKGVWGLSFSPDGYGGYFLNNSYAGQGGGGYGIYAESDGYAGYFMGDVSVIGTLSKSAGGFKIDHPLDPDNQYLSHSFVESPDMMNIYNGNITTDAAGNAVVVLPDYFEALNSDFRYQLTVIGEFAQAIVAEEIQDNRFTIRTDKPNIKVSWQATGIRHDPYAEQNRIPVEEAKPASEHGSYLYPQGYSMPVTMTVNYVVPESVQQ